MTVPETAAHPVRVTFLGTGDAFGSGGRLHSGCLVEAAGATFLLDCGPTILPALKRAGVDTGRIDFVLISHLHGDHFGGLPFLLLEYIYENPRTRPLLIAGPAGIADRTRRAFAAFFHEAAQREPPFPVEFHELESRREERFGGVEVRPFRVPHQTAFVSLGLRVTVAGRSILYSGDSAWTDEFIEQSQGTDLFICECFLFGTRVDYHLNYLALASHVVRLGCKRLVLTHLGSELLAARDRVHLECAEDGLVLLV